MIDLHCHILPGLDDGPATLDEALDLARLAVAGGVSTVVATPHMPLVSPDQRDQALALFRVALQQQQIPLKVLPGGEYLLDEQMLDRATASSNYLLGGAAGRRYLLVELPANVKLALFESLHYQAQIKGIQMVLAHAERLPEVETEWKRLQALAERGLAIQVNADSLVRPWWSQNRNSRQAKRLVCEGLASIVASDMHGTDFRPPRLAEARANLEKWLGPKAARELTETNPARLAGL